MFSVDEDEIDDKRAKVCVPWTFFDAMQINMICPY